MIQRIDRLSRIKHLGDLCKQIVDMLPSDPTEAKICISVMIDMWGQEHNMRSSELWKQLYDVAMYVHDKMGDCKL